MNPVVVISLSENGHAQVDKSSYIVQAVINVGLIERLRTGQTSKMMSKDHCYSTPCEYKGEKTITLFCSDELASAGDNGFIEGRCPMRRSRYEYSLRERRRRRCTPATRSDTTILMSYGATWGGRDSLKDREQGVGRDKPNLFFVEEAQVEIFKSNRNKVHLLPKTPCQPGLGVSDMLETMIKR
jgi:hypothetical protein